MGNIPSKSPIGFNEYLLYKRNKEIEDKNIQLIDEWLFGKIDSVELKRRIIPPLDKRTN